MRLKNQVRIDLSSDDIKNAIIKYLYHEQKISGIFDIKFNLTKESDKCILDSALIIVDTNYEIN